MGILIQPQRWTMKPPVGTQINWAHPLANGLVGCWLFENSLVNSADGVVASPGNSPSFATGLNGAALSLVRASTQYVTIEGRIAVSPLTYVFLVKATTLTGGYNAVISRYASGTDNCQLFVKSNGTLAVYMASSNGLISYDGTGIHTVLINKWYQLATTWGSNGILAGYVNGELDKSVSGNAIGTMPQGVTTRIGSDSNVSGREWNGLIESGLIYSRVLSQSELQWLYVEPYAFMQPMAKRRWFISTVAVTPPPGPATLLNLAMTETLVGRVSVSEARVTLVSVSDAAVTGVSVTESTRS